MTLLLLALALAAQDKVLLQHQPKTGDKLATAEKMEMNIHLVVNANGQKLEMDVAQRESKKTTMECQSVDGGQITKATYKVEEAIEEKKPPGATDFERSEKSIHGKTIVVERKDGKLER